MTHHPTPPEHICRNCLRPLTWETREEPGYQPREGWYDDHKIDPLICWKAISYRHVPLEGRELACYRGGFMAGAEAVFR